MEDVRMAYLKPANFTRRVFNPLAMRFGIGGAESLTIAGRRSGRLRSVPVIPVELDGTRYLVSPRGETEWVRNLRAAGGGVLRRKNIKTPFRATEIPSGDRASILSAYRRKVGREVTGYFTKLPDPADHPVFRIEQISR
jgi:deazaflavin-dependent oxidoreductase (nitroreductase family)